MKLHLRGVIAILAMAALTPAVAANFEVNKQLPQVSGALPVTQDSYPFLHSSETLEAVSYVEEEFLLSGQANVYDWTGNKHDIKVVAGPGKYVTRILVRRPKDPSRFSGNIEVKVLNATRGYDYGTFTDFERMTREGDAWIGITSKAINANALKQFDPERYAMLDWSSPVPLEHRCDDPTFYPSYMIGDTPLMKLFKWVGLVPLTSWPETEDGMVWDMLGQLGLLLKSDDRQKILPGFSKPTLYMTGISQSSILIHTWFAGFHDLYRMPDGEPVYDGYLSIVGPALARLNQCSSDIPLDDPRQKLDPPDVPFITLSSEGEKWITKYTLQPDVFTRRGGLVTYEVAGASHRRFEPADSTRKTVGIPSEEDVLRAVSKVKHTAIMEKLILGRSEATDYPWAPIVRGAFNNLKLWVRQGIKPPQAPPLARDATLEIKRDPYGNALGGVRMPYVDVPLASYVGSLSAGGLGALLGTRTPLPKATLHKLYPDKASYIRKFAEDTDKLTRDRWILPEDAAALKQAAAETTAFY